jgi:hypothetical protein
MILKKKQQLLFVKQLVDTLNMLIRLNKQIIQIGGKYMKRVY